MRARKRRSERDSVRESDGRRERERVELKKRKTETDTERMREHIKTP